MKHFGLFLLIAFVLALPVVHAQKYTYAAQKKFIPADLGQVYLGMPFKAFAAKIPVKNAEADTRFEHLELIIPYKKGNITGLVVRIHGLDEEEKKAITRRGMVKDKNDLGEEYERETDLLDASKIPAKGIVYAMYISFKEDFDIKAWSAKTYGKPSDVYKKGDNGYFYDYQWGVKSADGLQWLVRCYFNEGKSLQLLGRIKGTEWDPNI